MKDNFPYQKLTEDGVRRGFRLVFGVMIFVWILGIAFAGGVVYVAWHFISKLW